MEHEYIMHIKSIDLSLPESVVSPGIALAISAMAFPSCCIRDTTADGDVGINVGADEEDAETINSSYELVWTVLIIIYLHLLHGIYCTCDDNIILTHGTVSVNIK